MKNKAPLVLTELMIMLLVFALAAGLCLRVFQYGDQISRDSLRDDLAVAAAQTGAEWTKHYRGDLQTAAAERGGEWNGETWTLTVEECSVAVTLLPGDNPCLGIAKVTAWDVELTVSWQKEGVQ